MKGIRISLTGDPFLLESDAAYFELAAKHIDLEGARLLVCPEFTDLPAACTVTSVPNRFSNRSTREWMEWTERSIQAHGFSLSRLYLTDRHPVSRILSESGYRSRAEIGYVTGSPRPVADSELSIHPLDLESNWLDKQRIHATSRTQPDGYEVSAQRWTEFELAKSRTGKLTAHLVWENSTALATFCTLEHNGYLRLKNLLVDPAHRRRGIGERVIRALEGLATRERLQGVLALAVSGGPGEFLYQSAGMKPIGRVIEWRKHLS